MNSKFLCESQITMRHQWNLTCLFAFSSGMTESAPVCINSDGVASDPRQVDVEVESNPGAEIKDGDMIEEDKDAKKRDALQLKMHHLAERLYPEKGA